MSEADTHILLGEYNFFNSIFLLSCCDIIYTQSERLLLTIKKAKTVC